MKVACKCPACNDDVVASIGDNLMGTAVCSMGHRSRVVWVFGRHHALLDSAIFAFLEGFRFEAVASLSAGLERFNEYYMRSLWRKHFKEGIDRDRLWKLMSKQTERQLGALYVAQCLERTSILEVPSTEFRNKVIHKGYLPSADEVRRYGTEVFAYVCQLRTELFDFADEASADEEVAQGPEPDKALPLASTYLSLSAVEGVTFETALRHGQRAIERRSSRRPFEETVPGETIN